MVTHTGIRRADRNGKSIIIQNLLCSLLSMEPNLVSYRLFCRQPDKNLTNTSKDTQPAIHTPNTTPITGHEYIQPFELICLSSLYLKLSEVLALTILSVT